MICDQLKNSAVYESMCPAFQKAFDYLKSLTPNNLPDGRLALDGERMFVLTSRYETQPANEKKIEAHRAYLDIQYIVSGTEAMGYIPAEGLEISEPYRPDVEFYNTTRDVLIPAEPGTFMIFFPQDAHRPGCTWKKPSQITKVIVKIAI